MRKFLVNCLRAWRSPRSRLRRMKDALTQFTLVVFLRLRLGIPQRGDDFSAPSAEAPQRGSNLGKPPDR